MVTHVPPNAATVTRKVAAKWNGAGSRSIASIYALIEEARTYFGTFWNFLSTFLSNFCRRQFFQLGDSLPERRNAYDLHIRPGHLLRLRQLGLGHKEHLRADAIGSLD